MLQVYICVYIYMKQKLGREEVGHCLSEVNKFYINTDMSICRIRSIEMLSVLRCTQQSKMQLKIKKLFQRIGLHCIVWQSGREMNTRTRYVSQHSIASLWPDGASMPSSALFAAAVGHEYFQKIFERQRYSSSDDQHNSSS